MKWSTSDDESAMGQVVFGGEILAVYRLKNWGWELRGERLILRTAEVDCDLDKVWEDLTSNIILQQQPAWAEDARPFPYKFREVPDEEGCMMLNW